MVRQYRTREGEATAVDTKTALTTLGSESAPGPLLVPAGMTKVAGVIIASCADGAAAGAATAFVRLEGPGLPEGTEVIAAGAYGYSTTAANMGILPGVWIPLNVKCTPANEILVFGEMAGADIGSVAFAVTVVFEA